MEVITSVCVPETIVRNPSEKRKKQQSENSTDIQRERPQTTALLFHRGEATSQPQSFKTVTSCWIFPSSIRKWEYCIKQYLWNLNWIHADKHIAQGFISDVAAALVYNWVNSQHKYNRKVYKCHPSEYSDMPQDSLKILSSNYACEYLKTQIVIPQLNFLKHTILLLRFWATELDGNIFMKALCSLKNTLWLSLNQNYNSWRDMEPRRTFCTIWKLTPGKHRRRVATMSNNIWLKNCQTYRKTARRQKACRNKTSAMSISSFKEWSFD